MLIAERGNHRIRGSMITPNGASVFTLAGDGVAGDLDSDVDGKTARFLHPRGLMLASPSTDLRALSFFVVDVIDRIRTVSLQLDNIIELATTVGTATTRLDGVGAASRDDGGIDSALFRAPTALAFVSDDRLVVVDELTGRLRLVTPSTGVVRTISGMPDGLVVGAEAVAALVAQPLRAPAGIVLDPGVSPPTLYVSEAQPPRLRRFTLVDVADPSTWTTSVVVVVDDTGAAPFGRPAGLGIDVEGRVLFVADSEAHVVHAVDLVTGTSTIVAGVRRRRGVTGDDGPATSALLNQPEGVAFIRVVDANEEDVVVGAYLLVADTGNSRVRRVALGSGTIIGVLGDGSSASGGDGAPAVDFPVRAPRGLALDVAGNLLVTSENAIRFVQAGDGGLPAGSADVRSIMASRRSTLFPNRSRAACRRWR